MSPGTAVLVAWLGGGDKPKRGERKRRREQEEPVLEGRKMKARKHKPHKAMWQSGWCENCK